MSILLLTSILVQKDFVELMFVPILKERLGISTADMNFEKMK